MAVRFRLAAAQRNREAHYNLGTLFFKGDGTAQNFAEAAKHLREAAIRGHASAQSDLGMMYFEGKGLARDLRLAYYWLSVASLQGDDIAQEQMKVVATGMSAREIIEASTQAREWMEKAKKTWK